MAATGDWELVVKNNKKGKNANVANGKIKEERKDFRQKPPKTIFNGAYEPIAAGKENRQPKPPKVDSEPKKKEKKSNSNVPQQPGTMDEALKRLSVGEIQSILNRVATTSSFADSPLIWLKDLASYLNIRVNPVRQPDPIFKGQEPSYPVSRLNVEVKKLLMSTLSKCSDTALASFHKHCINSMVQDQAKGECVAGYKLFLQILSIEYPHVGIVHLESYCELRQKIQNQLPSCLSLLWVISQSGMNDFGIGLRIWIELMVPLIGLKNYSAYVVEFGSNVFSGGGGGGTNDYGDILGVREFFSILDFTWCSAGSLSKSVQRQLFALYPKVKTTAFTSKPDVILHNFFPSFLRRLSVETSEQLQTELRTCLVQCLMQDSNCWNVWSQLYLKHLPQSAILLSHLGTEVNLLNQLVKTSRTEVERALISFARTNKKVNHKINSAPGLAEATEATNVLLSQLKKVKISSKSSGSRVWSVLITLLVAGIVWDVKSAGSFYGSRIGWALERAGLVPYLEVLGKSIKSSTIQAYRWCIYNIPFYYSKGCDLAEPYLLLVWSRFEGVAAYAWTGVQSAVDYIPVIKENIETSLPGLSSLVSHYGMAALAGAQSMAVAVKEVSMPYLLQVHDFISTRVLVGALAPEKLYEYILHSVDYVSQLLMKLHSTLLDDFDTHTDEASINSSL